MKRTLAVGLAVALILGAFLSPAEAGKRKKKKKPKVEAVDATFFMRRDDCDTPRLSLEDGEDEDCSWVDAMLFDFYMESGLLDPTELYEAVDGVPFVLDATKPIKGTITIRSWNGVGAGNPILDIALVGTSGGEEKELGTFSEQYTATPTGEYTFEYEFEPVAELNKMTFESLVLKVFCHGPTVGRHCMIEHDEPISSVIVPTLVPSK